MFAVLSFANGAMAYESPAVADDAHNHDGSHESATARNCGGNYLLPGEIARLGSHSFMILGEDGPEHIIAEHRSGTPPHNYQFVLRVRLDAEEMSQYRKIRSESKTLPAFTTIDFDEKGIQRGRTFFCLPDLPRIFGPEQKPGDEFQKLFPIRASLQKDADHEGSFEIQKSVVRGATLVLDRADVQIVFVRYLPAYLAQEALRQAVKANPDELFARMRHAPIRANEETATAMARTSYGATDGAIGDGESDCPRDFYLKKAPVPRTIHSFLLLAELAPNRVLATHYYDYSPQNYQTVLELTLTPAEMEVYRKAKAGTNVPPLLQTRLAARGKQAARNFSFCMGDLPAQVKKGAFRFDGTIHRASTLDDYRLGESVGTVALDSREIKVLVNRALLSFLNPALVGGDVMGPRAVAATLPQGFVDLSQSASNIPVEARYFSDWNFTGRVVPGYEANKCYLTRPAAEALKKAQKQAQAAGYSLLVFDCYRPQRAVSSFMTWVKDDADQKMKSIFFPEEVKSSLVNRGYLASRSGHSRGSTVDLTLVRAEASTRKSFRESVEDCRQPGEIASTGQLPMGTIYDCFSVQSGDAAVGLSEEELRNRAFLKKIMQDAGFKPYSKEWWHFTLVDEPFKTESFDFVVR